ncbi:hypothetical protein FB554_0418 [Barrientosiimonas humi]|uniref:Ribbon-helix-helix CopG family protein n=1 Tax=Barrientosiimonas humi TaxID=999931 RepID=A0A542X8Y3_9MICO|nr:DNA-binding protein [Barrientosiimonas humi]TQL32297.1 hypothetical protein FB554_0418 [Barrientosiimonas humi]CAG7572285.1 hypothetical protein BH39T_PBIAJDOK_00899 [Barrientosiimonas humi]
MAMTLRLTDEQTASLRDTAEREGRSMHAVVVQAIEDYTAHRRQLRDELLTQIVTEDADVLRRLEDA